MLLQFICHLINDEAAARRQCVVCFLEKRTFLIDLENAERNARKNIIAFGDASPLQFVRQARRVSMDNVHAPIPGKLSFQIASESLIQLKQEQMRIWTHAPSYLA